MCVCVCLCVCVCVWSTQVTRGGLLGKMRYFGSIAEIYRDRKLIRNVYNYLPKYMVLHPQRQHYS